MIRLDLKIPEYLMHFILSNAFCFMKNWNLTILPYDDFRFLSQFQDIIIIIIIIIILGGACGVMVIIVGNGHGDTGSNPGRDWLHFT